MDIKDLEQYLREASKAYYNSSKPIISDADFDKFKFELEKRNPSSLFLKEIGAIPSDPCLQKVSHTIPMGSLKKMTTLAELESWLKPIKSVENIDFVVQPKLDGASVELVFNDGNFVQAITRGDGEVGEDVTHIIKNAKGFPKRISKRCRIYVRCEAIIFLKEWKTHFKNANPRNTVSGLLRRTDAKGSNYLTCIAFDVLFGTNSPDGTQNEKERMRWLKREGFEVVSTTVVQNKKIKSTIDNIELNRQSLPFEIDGAVVKINNLAIQKKLGEHHKIPYWARAWKFAALGGS